MMILCQTSRTRDWPLARTAAREAARVRRSPKHFRSNSNSVRHWRWGVGFARPHEDGNADCARVVENYIYRNPVPWVMKAADGTVVEVTAGDWLVGAILKPKTWEQFEKGLIGPTSIQGRVSRIPAREQTIARYRSAS